MKQVVQCLRRAIHSVNDRICISAHYYVTLEKEISLILCFVKIESIKERTRPIIQLIYMPLNFIPSKLSLFGLGHTF